MEPIDHLVSRYALDIVAGDEIAGDLARLACERYLLDHSPNQRELGLYGVVRWKQKGVPQWGT